MLTVENRNALVATILIFFMAQMLAGCKSTPQLREIPIPVACIKSMPIDPPIEFDLLPTGSPFSSEIRALLIDHAVLQASLKEAQALMVPCLIP